MAIVSPSKARSYIREKGGGVGTGSLKTKCKAIQNEKTKKQIAVLTPVVFLLLHLRQNFLLNCSTLRPMYPALSLSVLWALGKSTSLLELARNMKCERKHFGCDRTYSFDAVPRSSKRQMGVAKFVAKRH